MRFFDKLKAQPCQSEQLPPKLFNFTRMELSAIGG